MSPLAPAAPNNPGSGSTLPPLPPSGSGLGNTKPSNTTPGNTAPTTPPPADLTATGSTKLEFTKPPSSPTVTPVSGSGSGERVPSTSYDVDIYDPKPGDSYPSIAREFYNDTRYAAALQAYNRNKPIRPADPIEVPPIYILKRMMPAEPGGGVPAAGPGSSAPAAWNPSGTPAARSGGHVLFRVPQGGMSMRAVARWTLGNEQRWTEIYDLNPQAKPDEKLPAGTELKLPADARLPG
jgi:LysM repeat protein